ncbi:MAG TPA: bacteriohemerythrin [Azospirillaceae bacterium]|nr:bacteriohemerythrin [Azospirillaceae bacterium]
MAKIVWREKLSVGVEAIDSDHRTLIEHINTLDSAIHAQVYDSRAVAITLLRLIEYTKKHFEREERIMVSVQYPGYIEHHREHVKAVQAIGNLSKHFTEEPTKKNAEHIYQFTTDWLVNHIIMSDTKITPYTKTVKF